MRRERVLITGCSSGIGKATAELLIAAGHEVVVTAPTEALLADCPSAALALVLDVISEASVREAVDRTERDLGPVSVLINNAGICQAGPVEQLSDVQVQRQFEVNVFGPMRLVRAVLPGMRRAGRGRIINLSSLVGVVPFPFLGAYSASKHAVEAFSDALRLEAADAGIEVVVVEPGWIKSNLASTAHQLADERWTDPGQPYANALRSLEAKQSQMERIEGVPADVARVICEAVAARRPRTRYRVTAFGKVFPLIHALASDRLMDRLHRLMGGF